MTVGERPHRSVIDADGRRHGRTHRPRDAAQRELGAPAPAVDDDRDRVAGRTGTREGRYELPPGREPFGG